MKILNAGFRLGTEIPSWEAEKTGGDALLTYARKIDQLVADTAVGSPPSFGVGASRTLTSRESDCRKCTKVQIDEQSHGLGMLRQDK